MSRDVSGGVKVVVVGGAGFLGSHLVNHLVDDRRCTNVLVLDNLSSGRREYVNKRAAFEHVDIVAASEIRLVNIMRGAHYVFNYAAMPYIPVSFSRPHDVFQVNATAAMKVISAARTAGALGILQVSSAEIYGECVGGTLSERATVAPHSSYGAAKAAVDYWVQCRWREAYTPCIALRQFNCVGERETHPYIVPEIIGQLTKQSLLGPNVDAVVRLGNNSSRDFMYAGDAVKAAVGLIEQGSFGEVYNLGSETSISMYDLALLVGDIMGCFKSVTVQKDATRQRPWEIWHLASDNAKIMEALGSSPSANVLHNPTDLTKILEKTIAWYNNNCRRWAWEA